MDYLEVLSGGKNTQDLAERDRINLLPNDSVLLRGVIVNKREENIRLVRNVVSALNVGVFLLVVYKFYRGSFKSNFSYKSL